MPPDIKAVFLILLPCPCAPKKRLKMSPSPWNVVPIAKKDANVATVLYDLSYKNATTGNIIIINPISVIVANNIENFITLLGMALCVANCLK